jgi:acyl-CoA reductase-like NAD-dependent aldehyde dehydrogenase
MSESPRTTQLKGLLKIGDVLIPGDDVLPSFSASGCATAAPRMLPYLNEGDRRGVELLLAVFRFLPRFAVRALFWLTEQHRTLPEPLAAPLRLANLGVKGVVMTLYYSDVGSGSSVHAAIGWDAKIVETGATSSAAREASHKTAPPSIESVPSHPAKQATAAPVAGAVARARAGSLSLSRLSVAERLRYVAELQQLILARREEIVDRIQRETRKSRADALISEIYGVLDNLAWLQKFAPRALGDRKEHTPLALMGKTSWTWYEPLGTILVISPWNYPFYQAIVPIASAFVAGNTVVYKPSEWTPLEGLVEDLLAAAQFAPNWVQVVYGGGRTGAELIDQRPDKIFFTGSTRTGRKIMAQAAQYLIPVELELGGKDAMIVFDDVNLTRAAAGAAWGALTTTGQSCTSVERLYVHEAIYEPFKAALLNEVERLRQAADGDADMGAMTTDFQVEIVAGQVADAKDKGARFLTGADWDGVSPLIPPMVVEHLSEDMQLLQEETFGPVIPLLPFKSEEEVIGLANGSSYGLTASVWTKDLDRARRVARALHVGGVSINNVMATEANPALPFGGVKESGFGRYKGEHGLHAFCNVKSVLIDKDSAKIEANWYPYDREKYRLFSAMMTNLFTPGLRSFVRFVFSGLKLERYSNKAAKRAARPTATHD